MEATAVKKDNLTIGLIKMARPKQWAKNLLVIAAPGAAGALGEPGVLADVALAFVAFCLVSSGTYYLNDASDMEADRRHPEKRHRPVASGSVPKWLAVAGGVMLLLGGLALALAVNWVFLVVVASYVTLTTNYTLWLKNVPVIEIAVVASGFFIRAIGGGVAADVYISPWFLLVTAFGSLFLVAGKRHGEHLDLGNEGATVRPTLGEYTREYLRHIWTVASAVTITAYCLWAFERPETSSMPWYELSIIPFVLGAMRYGFLLETGKGATPEDVVLGDNFLLIMGAVWIATLALGVYA